MDESCRPVIPAYWTAMSSNRPRLPAGLAKRCCRSRAAASAHASVPCILFIFSLYGLDGISCGFSQDVFIAFGSSLPIRRISNIHDENIDICAVSVPEN